MGLYLAFADEPLIAHLIDPAIRDRSGHSSDRDDAILGTSINDRRSRLRERAAVACLCEHGRMAEPTPHQELHKDGSVRARGQMLDDEMHGYWEWFRLDGSIMRSGSFDRGRQIGVWTTYDRSGAPHKETQFGQ
ncbi:toxin-antitoxin system YwqK family antitoxin [Microbacterium sp. Leaf288]|uniref:toxin-antitoxin system YwqK family antitoxin n=1 Tax=Microbacterium sp. Leaf288 TaxID=1736323 RepID=UPI000AC2E582|nr:hypothetical protein [Microbacterium sp. Leaf288]